ncbi:MAG: HAMP domain-containing histidine kinase [Candidatus Moranbacteria bacterium]|nr:HAMP domain-containing histidine kinase [Candidatus Moranbacteria bacterium]
MTDLVEPIYRDDFFSGFCIACIDIPKLILNISQRSQKDFVVSVFCEGQMVSSSGTIPQSNLKYTTYKRIENQNMQSFEVQLIPTLPHVVKTFKGSRYWLLYGLIFSLITSALVYFTQAMRRKNEELKSYLRDRQRLESIGVLASSVAHEINTPINGIMNYGDIIIDLNDKESETAQFAQDIIYETNRVSNLVSNLLQYSRQTKQEYKEARPEDILLRTTSLMNTMLKRDHILVRVDCPYGLPDVLCNSQQIQQVLINLLTNARDAVNEKFGEDHESKDIRLRAEVINAENKNSQLRLSVTDNGSGISEEIQKRIFNQFYTTKKEGEGTGLGLYISMEIVKEHGGKLSYETKKGEFTKFMVDLPLL